MCSKQNSVIQLTSQHETYSSTFRETVLNVTNVSTFQAPSPNHVSTELNFRTDVYSILQQQQQLYITKKLIQMISAFLKFHIYFKMYS
jgi:hypothetical protein